MDGENRGLLESVGLMVYEGTQSLNYVDNYAHGTSQWEGFPITVDVTISDIMLGCKAGLSRMMRIFRFSHFLEIPNTICICIYLLLKSNFDTVSKSKCIWYSVKFYTLLFVTSLVPGVGEVW